MTNVSRLTSTLVALGAAGLLIAGCGHKENSTPDAGSSTSPGQSASGNLTPAQQQAAQKDKAGSDWLKAHGGGSQGSGASGGAPAGQPGAGH